MAMMKKTIASQSKPGIDCASRPAPRPRVASAVNMMRFSCAGTVGTSGSDDPNGGDNRGPLPTHAGRAIQQVVEANIVPHAPESSAIPDSRLKWPCHDRTPTWRHLWIVGHSATVHIWCP